LPRNGVHNRAEAAPGRGGIIREIPAAWSTLFCEQAAELLGVSRRTIYDRIREGRLRTIRAQCGSQRVLIASIEALLREQAARARNRESGGAAANCRGSGAASLLECESGPQRHRSRATWSISSCQ
jgi:excisionase family DNA binding protein